MVLGMRRWSVRMRVRFEELRQGAVDQVAGIEPAPPTWPAGVPPQHITWKISLNG
jgi:hypothetical protein